MTDWYKSNRPYHEGEELPEFDTTSSSTTVYQRRNAEIVEHPKDPEDPESEMEKSWNYEERKMTHEEYGTAQIAADFVRLRHDSDVIDQYTEELIIGGLL